MPVMESMGARVLDEHPYHLAAPGYWIHDWGLQFAQALDVDAVSKGAGLHQKPPAVLM